MEIAGNNHNEQETKDQDKKILKNMSPQKNLQIRMMHC